MDINRMVFFHIGWMRDYRGDDDDDIIGGGSYIDKTKTGGEVFNFLPYNSGYVYGYVQPSRGGDIDINRICDTKFKDRIEDVLIIWSAKNPGARGGRYIVGWYKNATVYRTVQELEYDPEVYCRGNYHIAYFARTKIEDGLLLPINLRNKKVLSGKEKMGQSLIWYADSKYGKDYRKIILDYIEKTEKSAEGQKIKKKTSWARQVDPEKRIKVEKAAIEVVTKHFEGIGYHVRSVQEDNVGWDLEANKKDEEIMLEVKGLSGDAIRIELTPNEYEKASEYFLDCKICIVANALGDKPQLHVFSCNEENGPWTDKAGMALEVEKRIAAIMTGVSQD